jgi:hypothetical protein
VGTQLTIASHACEQGRSWDFKGPGRT